MPSWFVAESLQRRMIANGSLFHARARGRSKASARNALRSYRTRLSSHSMD
jgi:hypothetical protein